MKVSILVNVAIALLSITAAIQQPSPAAQLASITWLEGEWLGTFEGSPFWARYSSPEGGNILSMNKDLSGADEPGYIEFERFAYDDTSAFLVPYPGGRPHSLKFRLVALESSRKSATFRNDDNDWPTDITYARVSPDSLVITLSGPGEGGQPQVMEARLGLVKGK